MLAGMITRSYPLDGAWASESSEPETTQKDFVERNEEVLGLFTKVLVKVEASPS